MEPVRAVVNSRHGPAGRRYRRDGVAGNAARALSAGARADLFRQRRRRRLRLQRVPARHAGGRPAAREPHVDALPRRPGQRGRPEGGFSRSAGREQQRGPGAAAARARVRRQPAPDTARGGAGADAGRAGDHRLLQSLEPVGLAARVRSPPRLPLERALHQPAADEGLARPPRAGNRRRPDGVLRAAMPDREVARPCDVHGGRGRPLVADRGRRLLPAGGEARGRDAHHHAEVVRAPRPGQGPRARAEEGARSAGRRGGPEPRDRRAVTGVVEIYADGACKGNPGIGGWGALLEYGSRTRELFGGEQQTTNNRMELTAVIRALEALGEPSRVRLHTDSQYVQRGISTWIHDWKRRGWRTADKKPVKNQDLWLRLDELGRQHDIEWIWVKGHAGNPGNERADELANRGCASVRS